MQASACARIVAFRLQNIALSELLYNNGKIYHLEGIRQLDYYTSMPTDRHGYAFKYEGETIATVRTSGKGKVWMKEILNEDTQLLVATVSAALLLQHPMRKS